MKIPTFLSISLSLLIVFYVLIIGKSLLLPLIIAIAVWYITLALSGYFESFKFGGKRIPHGLALFISFTIFASVVWIFISLLQFNISKMIISAPMYQERFQNIIYSYENMLGVSDTTTTSNILEIVSFPSFFGFMTNLFTNLAGYVGMIVIYLVLIFLEYKIFGDKIKMFINDENKYEKVREVIKKIDKDIKTYLSIKTVISLLTAFLSYLVLIFFGVDFPLFWAMIIFVLNFIPTIGSIIAVIFPLLFSLVQFGSLGTVLFLMVLLSSIQIAIGNILEPKLMGKSLNLSPLVIVLSLGLWGAVWGVVGMFLSIPIMVIINIVLSKFPTTRGIAVMLSATGKIK